MLDITINDSVYISALLTAVGGIITAKIAQKTAIKAAKREFERMERTWQREDIVSSDEEFAKMASVVASFVHMETGAYSLDATQAVAAIRSKETGQLASILDHLYNSIQDNDHQKTNLLLTEAISEKRRIKSSFNSK